MSCSQSSCRLGMGESPGEGLGGGQQSWRGAARFQHPSAFGLIHLGDQEKETEERSRGPEGTQGAPGLAPLPTSPWASVPTRDAGRSASPASCCPFAPREAGAANWGGPGYGEKLRQWGGTWTLKRRGQTALPKLGLEGPKAGPGAMCTREMAPCLICSRRGCNPPGPLAAQQCLSRNTAVVQASGWGLAWGKVTREGQGLSPKLLPGTLPSVLPAPTRPRRAFSYL